MIREKRTVNCWLLTKSKRKKGKEREEVERRKEREEEKERRRKRRKHEKNKGNCEGKPTKPLQLPFILPIELITAFFNFKKLISSGSASKQNYMMHTGHSCNFIDPFWCITGLSEAYLFRNPTAIKQKKEHPAPNCGSPFGFLFVQKTTFKRGDFHLQF